MIYGSICSGIEAATVAWHPLGWRPAFFSEIEAFPRAVLQHHYPETPLHGDFTTIEARQYAAIDLLVGGTPCQSFSVAGLRAGLRDERGNLALEFCLLARRLRPRWIVWENVPGVLSLDGGRAFASILGGLAECGYGLAYRVLDAQFVRVDGLARAVPQRRRRVFVVGYLGDWRRAAAVLFERESLRGDLAPRREAGKATAPTLAARTRGGGGLGTDFDCDGGLVTNQVAPTMRAGGNQTGGDRPYGTDVDTLDSLVAHTLNAKGGAGRSDSESETFLAEPVAFDETQITSADNRCSPQPGDPCHPLVKGGRPPTLAFNARQDPDVFDGHTGPLDTDGSTQAVLAHGVALRGRDGGATAELTGDVMTSLRTGGGGGDKPHVLTSWRVRRLMPVECERLQGFPDGYTMIPGAAKGGWRDIDETEDLDELRAAGLQVRQRGNTWRVKDPDGPRYKALGNSMAVNVMRWLGRRIEMVDAIGSGVAA
jgi:DNA (cytosine-5)-methyltransferase 1